MQEEILFLNGEPMKKTKADKDAKRLIRILNKPIKVESKIHGNLELRPLASGDFEFLSKIIELNLSARDFTVKIIRRVQKNASLGEKEIRAFSDAYLLMIATKLIKDRRMCIKDLPKGKITFELFKQELVDDHRGAGKELLASFARHLPWIIDFRQNEMEDIEKAEKILKQSGYRHTVGILKIDGFRIFANLGPKTLDATMTKIWLKLTRQEGFKDELKERFQKSIMLRRRWSIIESAWEAHRRGDYLLSVPVLFTQIEGILGDALILNHKARKKDGKLFVLGSDGKQTELTGISAIIDQPYFKTILRLEEVIKLLREDKIVQERNAILHGRKTLYGRAKLSTQSLLLIYVLIREAAEFEPPIVITS